MDTLTSTKHLVLLQTKLFEHCFQLLGGEGEHLAGKARSAIGSSQFPSHSRQFDAGLAAAPVPFLSENWGLQFPHFLIVPGPLGFPRPLTAAGRCTR